MLFPLAEYWWFYAAFTAVILVVLAVDLGIFHRKAHVVSMREAGIWSAVWIGAALVFNYALYRYAGWKFADGATGQQVGLEFLAGYLVEKALSLDNVFVMVAVFRFFAIPAEYQHRVLFYGILGALVFRSVFIALGSSLLQYHWVLVVFGVVILLTGVKMMLVPDKPLDPTQNP